MSGRSAVCFFQPLLQLSKDDRGCHCDCAFYIYLLLMQVTPTHVQSQPSTATLPKTPTPEVSLQTCAHVDYRRGSCPLLERLVDVCNP